MIKEHTLLVERYRPSTLENYVGNEQIKSVIQNYLDQNDIQNFIFAGNPGTGKTTLAKIIVNNLDCDYILINASDERGVDTIRDKVSAFASTASFKSIKVVILDEADFLTINAQASLRNVIEKFSRSTRFILTCNYVERMIDPLQSRCQVLKIVPPSKNEVAKHILRILEQEEIQYETQDVKALVQRCYPDLRKMLNLVQSSTVDGVLILDKDVIVQNNYMLSILKELSTGKNYTALRQILADSGVKEYEELYRYLFDNATKFAPGKEGSIAVILNTHLYQANFRIDKEINMASCLSQILETI